jgi:hypothetical protein
MELQSTIAISRSTRDILKQIGNKSQTYDEIINELIQLKENWKQDLLDRNGIGTPDDQANPSVHKRGDPLA